MKSRQGPRPNEIAFPSSGSHQRTEQVGWGGRWDQEAPLTKGLEALTLLLMGSSPNQGSTKGCEGQQGLQQWTYVQRVQVEGPRVHDEPPEALPGHPPGIWCLCGQPCGDPLICSHLLSSGWWSLRQLLLQIGQVEKMPAGQTREAG